MIIKILILIFLFNILCTTVYGSYIDIDAINEATKFNDEHKILVFLENLIEIILAIMDLVVIIFIIMIPIIIILKEVKFKKNQDEKKKQDIKILEIAELKFTICVFIINKIY